VAVEILAGPVIAHRGAWIGVAGGDLDVAQVHAGVEHGGDEGITEHVRVRADNRHAGFAFRAVCADSAYGIRTGSVASSPRPGCRP
jgi:hypothetical protein